MDYDEEAYEMVKNSWEDRGFLARLREGVFDRNAYNTLHEALLRLQSADMEYFEKEFVSVLWFIPIFMGRQKEYIEAVDPDDYERLKENLEDRIAGILGYP